MDSAVKNRLRLKLIKRAAGAEQNKDAKTSPLETAKYDITHSNAASADNVSTTVPGSTTDEDETEILLKEVENNGSAGSDSDGNLICSVEHSTWTTFNPNDDAFEGARRVKRFSVDLSAFPTATVPIYDLKPRTQGNFVSIRNPSNVQIDYYSKFVVLHKNLGFPYVPIYQKVESEAVKALSTDLPSILVPGYSGPLQSCGRAQRNSVFAHQPEIPEIRSTTGETRYSGTDNGATNRSPLESLVLNSEAPLDEGATSSTSSSLPVSDREILTAQVLRPEASLDGSVVAGPSAAGSLPVPDREIRTAQVLNSEAPLDVGATSSTGTSCSLPVPDGEILTAQVLNPEASLDGSVVAGPSAAGSLPVPDGAIRTAQSPSQPPGMLGSGMRDLQIFGIRRRVNNVAADQLVISSIVVRPRAMHPISPNDINDVFGVQLREIHDTAVGLVAASIDVRINGITDVEPAYEDNDIN